MKKNFGPQTVMYPMPVLIITTYDENGNADAMNAAWGGIHDTNQIGICLDKSHKTTKNIMAKKAFTVSFANTKYEAACDYLGIASGNSVTDKIKKAGFTVSKAEHVDAPVINELPLCIECKLVRFEEGSDYLFADIVNVCADEEVLTDGKIDPSKIKPITFDPVNHTYIELGSVVGKAFSDGKKFLK